MRVSSGAWIDPHFAALWVRREEVPRRPLARQFLDPALAQAPILAPIGLRFAGGRR
jgi:hypothetical protein